MLLTDKNTNKQTNLQTNTDDNITYLRRSSCLVISTWSGRDALYMGINWLISCKTICFCHMKLMQHSNSVPYCITLAMNQLDDLLLQKTIQYFIFIIFLKIVPVNHKHQWTAHPLAKCLLRCIDASQCRQHALSGRNATSIDINRSIFSLLPVRLYFTASCSI